MTHEEKADVLKQCLWAAIVGSLIHGWQGACGGIFVVLVVHAANVGT